MERLHLPVDPDGVAAVSPDSGPLTGGTVVTITGAGFANRATTATFGTGDVGQLRLDDVMHRHLATGVGNSERYGVDSRRHLAHQRGRAIHL